MQYIKCIIFILLLIQFVENVPVKENVIELSVIHINDFHARYEETSLDSGLCKSDKCIGGFSRLYATVTSLFKQKPNSILLNAGDNFEGTAWYNVHKWNITQYFLNKLPIDAFTLGNHEFEDKIEGLAPFLQHIKAPVVVSNIDASKEPTIEKLFNKSVVIERNGVKIGVIGVVLSTMGEIADIGNLVLLNESDSVNAEAERLVKEEGVFTNIVLSHCGYDVEKEIAKRATSRISLVVGGHSHSFLYTGESVLGPDIPIGPYPTVIENTEKKRVLVVQASSYTKYLGNITVFYNRRGEVVDWSGAPVFLGTAVPQDDEINEELIPWKKSLDFQFKVIGSTLVRLEQTSCPMAECLIGDLVTDAMVYAFTDSPEPGTWTNGSIAMMHSGGLRTGIDIGNITYSEIESVLPFNNTIDIAEIKGQRLKEILEFSVADANINLLQVSGVKVVFNLTMPQGSRVISLQLRCQKCTVPVYEDLDEEKMYRIILPSFLVDGGFGFTLFRDCLRDRQIGELDAKVFAKYVTGKSPVFLEVEGRIHIYR